jgi:hypothetical protein
MDPRRRADRADRPARKPSPQFTGQVGGLDADIVVIDRQRPLRRLALPSRPAAQDRLIRRSH